MLISNASFPCPLPSACLQGHSVTGSGPFPFPFPFHFRFCSMRERLLQQRTLIARYHGKNSQKTDIYMSLKPSNMKSMQFLTMTVDLIIKFCIDPSSRNWFLTFLSKIVKNRYKTILLASRRHQKWILNVFLYRINPKWSDLNGSKPFFYIFGHLLTLCWLSWHLVTS